MKLIAFQEHEAVALLDQLKLAAMSNDIAAYGERHLTMWQSMTESDKKFFIDAVHGKFHYRVTRWLQEQGASCVH